MLYFNLDFRCIDDHDTAQHFIRVYFTRHIQWSHHLLKTKGSNIMMWNKHEIWVQGQLDSYFYFFYYLFVMSFLLSLNLILKALGFHYTLEVKPTKLILEMVGIKGNKRCDHIWKCWKNYTCTEHHVGKIFLFSEPPINFDRHTWIPG